MQTRFYLTLTVSTPVLSLILQLVDSNPARLCILFEALLFLLHALIQTALFGRVFYGISATGSF